MTDIDRIFPTRLNFPVAGATMMIEVDARYPGWTCSNAGSWCTVKRNSDNVKVTASMNSTLMPRSALMGIISGDDMDDVEDITIEQSCKFNASNLILVQEQIHKTGCALTCVAMCVCQTQSQLQKDGFSLNTVDNWENIAEKYGYTYNELSSPSLTNVYDLLKSGYPAIVQVNDGSNGKTPHWVTVYQYTGTSINGNSLSLNDFMCADPYTGTTCRLNNATNINLQSPVNRVVVYKQKVC